jgi:hypothetical protein
MNPYKAPKYEKGPDTSNIVELIMSLICFTVYLALFGVSIVYHNASMAVLSCLLTSFFFILSLANITRRHFR